MHSNKGARIQEKGRSVSFFFLGGGGGGGEVGGGGGWKSDPSPFGVSPKVLKRWKLWVRASNVQRFTS